MASEKRSGADAFFGGMMTCAVVLLLLIAGGCAVIEFWISPQLR